MLVFCSCNIPANKTVYFMVNLTSQIVFPSTGVQIDHYVNHLFTVQSHTLKLIVPPLTRIDNLSIARDTPIENTLL